MVKADKKGRAELSTAGAPDAVPLVVDPIARLVFLLAKFPILPPISFNNTPPAPTNPGPSPVTRNSRRKEKRSEEKRVGKNGIE